MHHIKIDPTVAPMIHPPRKVPIALKDKIKTELNRMKRLGVIKKQTEPTDWVNSMVTVVKPNKLRICIDPKDLNKAIKRELFPLKTVEEVVSEMPKAKVFSVLDANQGCVLARIWRYDTGVAIRYIAIHCDTVSKTIYWDISYFRNKIYF